MRIDAHQHFWKFDPIRDAWITKEMAVIRRDFLPSDLEQTLIENHFEGCIAVQADQSLAETDFLIALAKQYPFIKGIVGWVDLQSESLDLDLQQYKQEPLIKGFRHLVEGEEDADFFIRPAFQRGLALLTSYGFTYDLLLRPRHYAGALACVQGNPKQVFILDHLAKPSVKTQEFDEWASFISELAHFPNVYCKISGLATEADWKEWKLVDFAKYIAHSLTCFGKDRIMFGSDWPVCLLAASYPAVRAIAAAGIDTFTPPEQEAFWGQNAVKVYNLK